MLPLAGVDLPPAGAGVVEEEELPRAAAASEEEGLPPAGAGVVEEEGLTQAAAARRGCHQQEQVMRRSCPCLSLVACSLSVLVYSCSFIVYS